MSSLAKLSMVNFNLIFIVDVIQKHIRIDMKKLDNANNKLNNILLLITSTFEISIY